MSREFLAVISQNRMLSFSKLSAQNLAQLRKSSLEAIDKVMTVNAVPFKRTKHPEAQWFPGATFGLFIHWGIHSVAGIEPYWTMMKNYPWQQHCV